MPHFHVNPIAVTPELVASWFPDSKFGRPSAEQCVELTASINRVRIGSEKEKEQWEKQQSGHEHLKQAARACEELRTELNALVRLLPSNEAHYRYIIDAAERFLRTAPDDRTGRPELFWVGVANIWAHDIAQVLTKPNKSPPSLKTGGGPVTTVLSEILYHCFGERICATDIGRRLHERQVRRKRQGNSS
jgi:hypothetical protein